MIELKDSVSKFWSVVRFDRDSYEIRFPVVDQEQIRRCQTWADYVESCWRSKVKPTREHFNSLYRKEPDGAA